TAAGDAFSGDAVLSRDNTTVAFDSLADDLVAGDFNGTQDVFASVLAPVVHASPASMPASLDAGSANGARPKFNVNALFLPQPESQHVVGVVPAHLSRETLIGQPPTNTQAGIGRSNDIGGFLLRNYRLNLVHPELLDLPTELESSLGPVIP